MPRRKPPRDPRYADNNPVFIETCENCEHTNAFHLGVEIFNGIASLNGRKVPCRKVVSAMGEPIEICGCTEWVGSWKEKTKAGAKTGAREGVG